MAESVVKLRVNSKEYDAKLKRAAEGVRAFGDNCRKAGESVNKADKQTLQYVQAIGKMDTVSKTVKGRINEMTSAFTELSVQYKRLTDEEKSSPFGRAMAQSLDQLKTRVKESRAELEELNNSLNKVEAKGSNFNKLFGGIAGQFGMSASMFTGVGAAVAGVGAAYKLIGDNISTARNFELSISQLSSLTGMVGKDLDKLKEYAIDLGSTTTLSASQVADAFKMIGSQQPQLLASGEALRDVTKAAITLAEAAGIDLATAAQSLSTSVNQFGGDSSNATRFVNVLAAASQKGAGDISFLGEAISKSGVLANSIGASYEELVANLEQLAQAGMDASTAGTALRSIIANLEKQSNNEFKPSVVGLTEAFKNMNNAQLTTVDYLSLAGKQFFSQAMILAENAEKAEEMTKAITGTNTAEEQAKTNTDNLDGSLKSLASAWEGLNLHINSSNGFLKRWVDVATKLIGIADRLVLKFKELGETNPFGGGAGYSGGGQGGGIRGGGETVIADDSETTTSGGGVLSSKKKKGKKTGRSGHKTTPAERAQQMVASALQSYAETMREADIRMEVGLDDTLAHQKRELQAQQQLMSAYAKASAVYDDPKYRAAYTETAEKFKTLGKTIADTEEEAKKTKEWFKEAERDFKLNTGSEPMSLESRLMSQIGFGKMEADNKALSNIMTTALKNGIDTSFINVREIQEKIAEGLDIPDSEWKNFVTIINEKLKELDIKPIKLNVETGEIEKVAKQTKNSWHDAANAIMSVGSALQQLQDPAAKIAGIVGEAIATIALAFAQASAKETKSGIWGWIAATAVGLGTMIRTIAAIKSATAGNYAQGGIIPGNSFSGDNQIMIGTNAGELILNRAQQAQIAGLLTNNGLGSLHLEASLDGEDIRLAVRNGNRRRGRGEYVESKSR